MAACRHARCDAPPVAGADACWGHASDKEFRALLRLSGDVIGGRLVAPYVSFTADRLRRILEAMPRDESGRSTLHEANFEQASFADGTSFDGVVFAGAVSFDEAVFEGSASFDESVFEDAAWFSEVGCTGELTFDRARFAGAASFSGARLAQASFVGTTFEGEVSFQKAAFSVRASFDGVRCGADLVLTDVTAQALILNEATCEGATTSPGVEVTDDATFSDCAFLSSRHLGDIRCKRLDLSNSVWHERVRIDASAEEVVGTGARFLAGGHLELGSAAVTLEGADLAAPTILTSPGEPAAAPRTRLTSLVRADVAGLAVSDIDLAACELAGAHHLSQLRIDSCTFVATPDGWWRTRRSVVVEEKRWRAEKSSTRGAREAWAGSQAAGARPALRLDATQIAAVYRELRKGREDAKDEPGAADFYYGEMEMRRLATSARHRRTAERSAPSAAGEHVILTLYWLVAGYGLRAWRALLCLGVLVSAAGVVFARWGIRDSGESNLTNGLLVSARAATAGIAGSEVPLTTIGGWLQLAMRLLGPVLLGLALLSIRGRVRR